MDVELGVVYKIIEMFLRAAARITTAVSCGRWVALGTVVGAVWPPEEE
eukprot:gene1236-3886_t